jgi:hypothetical protein
MADPVEREQLFTGLCNEASLLTRCWRLHIQLYGNGQHVELMRESAIWSFGLFQKVLQDSIVLSCQRLLDPAKSRGNTTASIEALIQMIDDPADAELRSAAKRRLKGLRGECRDVEALRDRVVAHRDRATVLGTHPLPLQSPKTRTIDAAVADISRLLQVIGDHLFEGMGPEVNDSELDGDTLMLYVQAGLAAQARRP